ncbi:MAG: hypothetical protein SFT81_04820 [Candidatus Caenarcaniphilales bacterium]|nr:hypothetical protein [Candidatus Caenarcaniphilales bacterium]
MSNKFDSLKSLDLLNFYLSGCSRLTDALLTKTLHNKLSAQESELAKEISHVANILSAIYFYRQDSDLENVLRKIPRDQRRLMENSFRVIWRHLNRLNESELAELAIEAIQTSARLSEKIKT